MWKTSMKLKLNDDWVRLGEAHGFPTAKHILNDELNHRGLKARLSLEMDAFSEYEVVDARGDKHGIAQIEYEV